MVLGTLRWVDYKSLVVKYHKRHLCYSPIEIVKIWRMEILKPIDCHLGHILENYVSVYMTRKTQSFFWSRINPLYQMMFQSSLPTFFLGMEIKVYLLSLSVLICIFNPLHSSPKIKMCTPSPHKKNL